jgi:PilZ domain-containing protein
MIQNLRRLDVTERRSKTRFPIALVARYSVPGRLEKVTGKTVNISSNGVLMTSTSRVSPGTSIRVVIEWPIVIGIVRPLALYIHGTVVRSDSGLVAVRFSTHEFRTKPKPPDRVKGSQNGVPKIARDFLK